MIIVYTPAGAEPEHFDARSLRVSEASIVSRTIDQTWREIEANLVQEDLDAMRGVAWVIQKRSNPTLRFGDFDPGVDEMVTRYDKTEVETYITSAVALARQEGADDDTVLRALRKFPSAALDEEHARAVIERIVRDPKDEADSSPLAPPDPSDQTEESAS
ncbi:hypothetical protein ACFU51_05005 [Streptomyces sp. NPDC057430]|uniref:hypothetical protein n=1 Tax=Streptomyces sp. NPDC057430 TaxID=3346131 RepID=UPI003695F621